MNADSYTYPVFQAGPRICLGKDTAFLQMKRVVAGIPSEFKVVPAVEGFQPKFTVQLTTNMKGGFLVRIVKKDNITKFFIINHSISYYQLSEMGDAPFRPPIFAQLQVCI